jgi:hypothetical protein
MPKRYDPLANLVEPGELADTLAAMRGAIADYAGRLPSHSQFLRRIGMDVPDSFQA